MKWEDKEYYNIDENDSRLIKEYLEDRYAKNGKILRTYTNISRTLQYYLETYTTTKLTDWETDDLELFLLWTEWKRGTIKKALGMLNPLFKEHNNSRVIPRGFLDSIVEKITPDECFSSFMEFDMRLTDELNDRYPSIKYLKDDITVASPTRAVYYLVWLGLSCEEIVNIKMSDCNTEQGFFIVGKEKRYVFFNQYSIMRQFFKEYKYAMGFYHINERYERPRYHSYVDTGYFVRTHKHGEKSNVNVMINRKRINPKLVYDKVYWSGRFEALYLYEQANGNINRIEDISKTLQLKGTKKQICTKLMKEQFLERYDAYKDRRNKQQ